MSTWESQWMRSLWSLYISCPTGSGLYKQPDKWPNVLHSYATTHTARYFMSHNRVQDSVTDYAASNRWQRRVVSGKEPVVWVTGCGVSFWLKLKSIIIITECTVVFAAQRRLTAAASPETYRRASFAVYAFSILIHGNSIYEEMYVCSLLPYNSYRVFYHEFKLVLMIAVSWFVICIRSKPCIYRYS